MKPHEGILIKPLTLLHWKLSIPQAQVEDLLSPETEIKSIENPLEILPLLYKYKVSYLVIGSPSSECFETEWMPILQRIPLNQRREIFVILFLPSAKTLDPWQTFLHSVNLLVNPEDMKELTSHLALAKTYFNELYEPYFRALKKFAEVLT